MKLKVFTKADCPNCPPAKLLAEEIEREDKLEVEKYDVGTPDGLAEAQFYSILATPSLILCDDSDQEKASWRGEVPVKEDVYSKMK